MTSEADKYRERLDRMVGEIEGGLLAHPTRHSIRQLTEMGDTASVIRAVDLLAAIDAHCAEREPEEPSPRCDHRWSRVLDGHNVWMGTYSCGMCREVRATSQTQSHEPQVDLAPTHLTPEEAAELEAEQGEPSEPTVQAAQDKDDPGPLTPLAAGELAAECERRRTDAASLRTLADQENLHHFGTGWADTLNAIADRLHPASPSASEDEQ